MNFLLALIVGLLLAYGALVFGAGAVKPREGLIGRCASLLFSLALTAMLMYLTFLEAGDDTRVVVWDAFGMSAKLTRETGDGQFRLHTYSPLLCFVPLGLGLIFGALMHRTGLAHTSENE